VYAVDPDRSLVTLRVYRAGRLAKLGHNHVITSANESGHAWTSGALATSGFEVRVAVNDLVVDDPAARAAAGEDFPGELSEAARQGTRNNMLRAEVLDGEHYPEIVVRASALGGTWDQPGVSAAAHRRARRRFNRRARRVQRPAIGVRHHPVQHRRRCDRGCRCRGNLVRDSRHPAMSRDAAIRGWW
jgi:hypothetical protein